MTQAATPAPAADGEPSHGERKGERTRRRILETARRLFAELGYERATIRGIAAAAEVDVGTLLSGTASAPEMLPGWAGALGQLLPPGAGGQLLRSTAYFDGRGTTHSIVVLSAWLVLGVVLVLVSGVRGRRPTAKSDEAVRPAAHATA
ncbi:TetR/AcrR family transcriptional regulator [Actinoplanes derwentensis]|uniref:Regulatory protein, tetR family n=1 Tax=Actinoplanes derwentensis TaxID=113562 RepID=A0A1H1UTJ8_9ACTN|nr:helix-turn-helix domain-containing protein [Actinoplanes derwentensis]GID88148.1 hypothetical protein Ade03nite_70720 [Actinoplanes derwentensis]SDS75189.1 regulatory protein, tetR family [Actinoplanes derwentensis]